MHWQHAHRIAMLAAARASAELDTDRELGCAADPYRAAIKSGLLVTFRPLRSINGIYIRDSYACGIVVNALHPLRLQRYTLAHELGHHLLGHASTLDQHYSFGSDVPAPSGSTVVRRRSDEMVAEAFAAWFLMPRLHVHTAMRCLGLAEPRTSFDVYQLSLRLAVSYEATARHLPNVRLASYDQLRSWLGVVPKGELRKIKHARAVRPLADARRDVWCLGMADNGQVAVVRPGDRLVLRLPLAPSGAKWVCDTSAFAGRDSREDGLDGATCVFDVPAPLEGAPRRERFNVSAALHDAEGLPLTWGITVVVEAPRLGIDDSQLELIPA